MCVFVCVCVFGLVHVRACMFSDSIDRHTPTAHTHTHTHTHTPEVAKFDGGMLYIYIQVNAGVCLCVHAGY